MTKDQLQTILNDRNNEIENLDGKIIELQSVINKRTENEAQLSKKNKQYAVKMADLEHENIILTHERNKARKNESSLCLNSGMKEIYLKEARSCMTTVQNMLEVTISRMDQSIHSLER